VAVKKDLAGVPRVVVAVVEADA